MKALLRYFSYLFHGLLALVLLAVSSLALATGPNSLRLQVLPWTGSTLTYIVFFGALFGLATVVLAVLRRMRWLFFIWSVCVAVMLVRGSVSSSYHFETGQVGNVLGFILASLVAVAGAWFQVRDPRSGMPKKKLY
ncbi:MAG: hypothetical protein LAQ30_11245 [Acidobacteriia bacterium]|nr:hypothetical protein [Terriglobia bacterium]